MVVLIGCTNTEESWQESALFTSGSYTMIGEEGKIGFIFDDDEATRFYPNKENKYMWHFWGEPDELTGGLKVIGTHESNQADEIIVLENDGIGGAHNGADAHIPSILSLPESGLWKLDAYFGDLHFGTIYVQVHEEQS